MSAQIWKTVVMPGGSELEIGPVLSVGCDPASGHPCIWHLSEPVAPRKIAVIGTGWNVPPSHKFLGTVVIAGFVWHLFEVFM